MHIIYPYNEILPKQTAHDVYIVHNCLSLSQQGLSVGLCCGWGSLANQPLIDHYKMTNSSSLSIHRLPILRNLGPLSLNKVFFWNAQRLISQRRPRWVLTSVFKQADYHVHRRLSDVLYGYEVHQLGWYPNSDSEKSRQRAAWERAILEKMDLITVTTQALRDILRNPPYSLRNTIEVVPLAVEAHPLPLPSSSEPFTVMYVGQLYESQGVGLLLDALAFTKEIRLEILGGKPAEVAKLKEQALLRGIPERVIFHGFVSPASLPKYVQRAHALVAPFLPLERMPYVAHTKLYEYLSWQRPIVAPALDIVKEHLVDSDHSLLFTPGDSSSLATALERAKGVKMGTSPVDYTWAKRAAVYKGLLT